MNTLWHWTPTAILGIAALFTVGLDAQRSVPLRAALSETIPSEIAGLRGEDVAMEDWEVEVAGVDDYLYRVFPSPDTTTSAAAATLYVGYYRQQTGGRTIHSPKNCLPGSGWQALDSQDAQIATAGGGVATVNRYLLTNDRQTALVLYWYQGRGRVQANEYRVKLDLLRDAALAGRSEEALVRIVVPVLTSEADAFSLARRMASAVIPSMDEALPG